MKKKYIYVYFFSPGLFISDHFIPHTRTKKFFFSNQALNEFFSRQYVSRWMPFVTVETYPSTLQLIKWIFVLVCGLVGAVFLDREKTVQLNRMKRSSVQGKREKEGRKKSSLFSGRSFIFLLPNLGDNLPFAQRALSLPFSYPSAPLTPQLINIFFTFPFSRWLTLTQGEKLSSLVIDFSRTQSVLPPFVFPDDKPLRRDDCSRGWNSNQRYSSCGFNNAGLISFFFLIFSYLDKEIFSNYVLFRFARQCKTQKLIIFLCLLMKQIDTFLTKVAPIFVPNFSIHPYR